MEKEFVPYEIALALKELGLKVKTPYWYNPNGVLLQKSFECDEDTTAVTIKDIIEYWDDVIKDRIDVPTYSQAFRWFREKYGLSKTIDDFYSDGKLRFDYSIRKIGSQEDNPKGIFVSYEDAQQACLEEMIQIIEQDGKNKSET